MALHINRRHSLVWLGACVGMPVQAQAWPSKPITMVVPYPAGGGTDAVARLIADKIGPKLGQTIVIDNKAGASGLLGTGAVAKAAPDGYTILVALSTQFVINPFLFKKLPYDPNKDIALVSQIVVAPIVLLAHPSVPANDVPSLIKYIGANKGKLSYGSYGIGSASHLSGAHLSQIAGGDMNHVPYKGEAPMLQDMIGGQVPMGFGSVTQAKAMIDGGRLKAIGVTGDKRLGALPSLPTFAEQGVKDDVFRTVGWIAMAAPGATPKAVIQRLADEVKAACALPDVRERMAGFGFEAVGRGPEEFAAIAKADAQVWSRLVKQTGATLD
jgi:tripartite-type tricarboxylate transporter receptor subunit TctC